MKINIHAVLIGVALLCGALVFYYSVQKKTNLTPSAIGSKVLPNLAINRVGKLVITSKDGVTTVAKPKEKWVVASRFNYPANFDKVADTVRELSELKVGQTVNVSPSQLDALNLVSPGLAGTNRSSNAGTMVELRDEKDGLLASLLIGKGFMRSSAAPSMEMMMNFGGYSDGQYIRTFDGEVYLVSKSLGRLTESAKTWLADDFINASASDLKEITVSGPDRAPIKLVRVKDGDSFTLTGLLPEVYPPPAAPQATREGELDSSKINQMTGALNRLGFDDVADPALPLKETGLDHPIVFRATTKDGLIYNLQIGNTLTNDNFDRYFTISITNEPVVDQSSPDKPAEKIAQSKEQKAPEKKSASEQAAELNGKFGSWIYVIKSYRAEPILLTRDDLIKKPEPPKTEEVQPNAPPKAAEETDNMPAADKQFWPAKKASEIKSKK